ncbi:Protein AAR2 homolog [Eumeta japonica]|uniref:Protein AAR2 homolog n=1 Tax=Eumeta variegata TaxID=151549 RepID=A0A4C2A4J5_EUMVA|nr:Protein AAR2 homolog [Eumeta japonica]
MPCPPPPAFQFNVDKLEVWPAAACSRSHSPSHLRLLNLHGRVPEETQFGIDMHCWNTAEDFRGVKMIPEGLHYIHYSAVSQSTGDVSPRSGFIHYFKKKEFLVKLWDKKMEDISKDQISDESIQRLKDNLFNIDRFLAPYPFENWQKWKILTSQITDTLAEKLSPETGIIRSSVELLSMTDDERPKGVRSSITSENIDNTTNIEEQATSEQQTIKRQKVRVSSANKEDSMLPDLKPAPGTAIRFTEVPKEKYPKGATPQEITKHHLDQTYTLETMIAQHDELVSKNITL